MSEVLIAIIGTGAGGVLTLVIVAVTNVLRTSSSLPRRVSRLEESSALTLDILDALTDGVSASLIALKEGKINGEASAALCRLRETKEQRSKFLASHAMGQTPEGVCK
jgi:hypothetical protein